MKDVIFIVKQSEYWDEGIRLVTDDFEAAKAAADDCYDIESVIAVTRLGHHVYKYMIESGTLEEMRGYCTLRLSAYLDGTMVRYYDIRGIVKVLAISEQDAMQQINAYIKGGNHDD